jgi:hypothetical protein
MSVQCTSTSGGLDPPITMTWIVGELADPVCRQVRYTYQSSLSWDWVLLAIPFPLVCLSSYSHWGLESALRSVVSMFTFSSYSLLRFAVVCSAWYAKASFKDRLFTTGWGELRILTNQAKVPLLVFFSTGLFPSPCSFCVGCSPSLLLARVVFHFKSCIQV